MRAGQWCIPMVQGKGAGLGNELIPWARAFLMSQVLGARCLHPAFGLNARPYHRHFGTSRLDWIVHRALVSSLPVVEFGEADYLSHGGGDVVVAFERFADATSLQSRSPVVVTTQGLWGGILHIERALEFVRGVLYTSRYAAVNLRELAARLDPERLTVAMHVRLGDFEAARPLSDEYRGQFNRALPLDWFIDLGIQLRQAFGARVQFQVFSDGTPAQLRSLVEAVEPVSTRVQCPCEVSDLLALASADLLLCSVSSYSVWAAALSRAPYVWFRHQLQVHDAAWLSVWGHEHAQQQAGAPTRQAMMFEARMPGRPSAGRAVAVGMGQALPQALLDELEATRLRRRRSADLVRYGVLAAGS